MEFEELVTKLKNNKNVYAAILFDSRIKGTYNKNSDYDVAVLTKNNDRKIITEIELMKTDRYDVIPFYKIPFVAQTEVFKYGRPLFIKDEDQYTKEFYYNLRTYQDNLHHYTILKKLRWS